MLMHTRRIISLVIVAFAVLLCLGAASKDEIARLRILMQWREGQTLADVGSYCVIFRKPAH